MTSLEAIGNSHQSVPLRGDAKPVVHGPEPKSVQPVEKAGNTEKAEKQPQAKRAELQSHNAHARLHYDEDKKEVFVEILDPQTGDVLQRFPAEELPDQIRAASSGVGSLVETIA